MVAACFVFIILFINLASTQPLLTVESGLYEDTVTLRPDRTNTLFQTNPNEGELSAGAQTEIFVGVTGSVGGRRIRYEPINLPWTFQLIFLA